jgi:hypothetical protein
VEPLNFCPHMQQGCTQVSKGPSLVDAQLGHSPAARSSCPLHHLPASSTRSPAPSKGTRHWHTPAAQGQGRMFHSRLFGCVKLVDAHKLDHGSRKRASHPQGPWVSSHACITQSAFSWLDCIIIFGSPSTTSITYLNQNQSPVQRHMQGLQCV